MAKLNVTDLAGNSLGEIEVADAVFAAPVKRYVSQLFREGAQATAETFASQ